MSNICVKGKVGVWGYASLLVDFLSYFVSVITGRFIRRDRSSVCIPHHSLRFIAPSKETIWLIVNLLFPFVVMYSVTRFSLAPSFYCPVYVISDSEMTKLKAQQHQDELDSVVDQRKRLEDAYEKQRKHFLEREKSIKSELKAFAPFVSNPVKETVEKAVEAIKDTAKKVVA